MPWDEAVRLAVLMHNDPTSHICAAVSGWDYPVSNEYLILADWFDYIVKPNVNHGFEPYRRPWPEVRRDVLESRPVSVDEAKKMLAQVGHTFN